MIHLPVLRFGQPYQSLDVEELRHFATGEVVAVASQANAGLIERDLRTAKRSREALREIPCRELLARCKKAGELFRDASLPIGDDVQGPADYIRCVSATTGIPENLCRQNRKK